MITFSKVNRITKSSQLYYVLNHGKTVENSWLSLSILKRESKSDDNNKIMIYNRLGIIIKKNIFKKAVKRNRFKRMAREFFRKNNIHLNEGYDFLLFVKKIPDIKDNDYYKEIKKLFDKISIK